jgi:Inner membrane protein YgaP-like, transmembrane domain
MFKTNEGTVDRALRVVVGAALILGYFLNPDGAWSWLYWLGIIPLVTGLVGWCGIYAVLGINTCKMKN